MFIFIRKSSVYMT